MSRYAAVADTRVAVSEWSPKITIATLRGDQDIASEGLVGETMLGLVNSGVSILVDLSDATFIDCSIVRVLDAVTQEAAKRDTSIVFHIGTRPIVEKVVDLTGASLRWRVYRDFNAAIAALDSLPARS